MTVTATPDRVLGVRRPGRQRRGHDLRRRRPAVLGRGPRPTARSRFSRASGTQPGQQWHFQVALTWNVTATGAPLDGPPTITGPRTEALTVLETQAVAGASLPRATGTVAGRSAEDATPDHSSSGPRPRPPAPSRFDRSEPGGNSDPDRGGRPLADGEPVPGAGLDRDPSAGAAAARMRTRGRGTRGPPRHRTEDGGQPVRAATAVVKTVPIDFGSGEENCRPSVTFATWASAAGSAPVPYARVTMCTGLAGLCRALS